MPQVQQGDGERFALHTISHNAVDSMSVRVASSQDHGIVRGCTKDIGQTTVCRDFLDEREVTIAIETLYLISFMPVASDENVTAVEFDGRGKGALLVETTEALETTCLRIVHLSYEGLSDAHMLLETSSQQDLACLHNEAETSVVIIDGGHLGPLIIFIVFSRFYRDES